MGSKPYSIGVNATICNNKQFQDSINKRGKDFFISQSPPIIQYNSDLPDVGNPVPLRSLELCRRAHLLHDRGNVARIDIKNLKIFEPQPKIGQSITRSSPSPTPRYSHEFCSGRMWPITTSIPFLVAGRKRTTSPQAQNFHTCTATRQQRCLQ